MPADDQAAVTGLFSHGRERLKKCDVSQARSYKLAYGFRSRDDSIPRKIPRFNSLDRALPQLPPRGLKTSSLKRKAVSHVDG